MKLFYLFSFLIILSCTTVKKEYVCGDHPCVDKKEFKEYFSKNLIIEIKSQDSEKNKSIDLVRSNTETFDKKKNNNRDLKKEEKIRLKNEKNEKKARLKNEKEKLKAEKIKVLDERKTKENKEKKIAKINKIFNAKETSTNEISKKREDASEIVEKVLLEKKINKKNVKTKTTNNFAKNDNIKSVCYQIEDCDIDKIAELLIKKGKDKPFPNIGSN